MPNAKCRMPNATSSVSLEVSGCTATSQRNMEHQAMNVSLTPKLEKLVNEKVKTGLYHSASEVVR
jgi:hypothetical protein